MTTDNFIAIDRFGNIVEDRGTPIKWRVVKHSYDSQYSLLEDVSIGKGMFKEVCILVGSQFSMYQYILKHAEKQRTIHDSLRYVTEIQTAIASEDYFRVAGLLEDVVTYRLYFDYGYENYRDFVKGCLGKSQTWGVIYARISSMYLNDAKTATVFAKDGKDFIIGQLIRLYPLPAEIVEHLLETGELTFTMSCNKITKLLADLKLESSEIDDGGM